MNPAIDVQSYCRVFELDGSVNAQAHEEPRIDAAVSRYVDSGKTLDTLLTLDMVDGSVYKTLASRIGSWYVSTPETRRATVEWEAAQRAENRQFRADAGLWDEDEAP